MFFFIIVVAFNLYLLPYISICKGHCFVFIIFLQFSQAEICSPSNIFLLKFSDTILLNLLCMGSYVLDIKSTTTKYIRCFLRTLFLLKIVKFVHLFFLWNFLYLWVLSKTGEFLYFYIELFKWTERIYSEIHGWIRNKTRTIIAHSSKALWNNMNKNV